MRLVDWSFLVFPLTSRFEEVSELAGRHILLKNRLKIVIKVA